MTLQEIRLLPQYREFNDDMIYHYKCKKSKDYDVKKFKTYVAQFDSHYVHVYNLENKI